VVVEELKEMLCPKKPKKPKQTNKKNESYGDNYQMARVMREKVGCRS